MKKVDPQTAVTASNPSTASVCGPGSTRRPADGVATTQTIVSVTTLPRRAIWPLPGLCPITSRAPK
jgi:hypothetical protein